PVLLRRCQDNSRLREGLDRAQALVAYEEECLFLYDGTAERGPKLVLLQDVLRDGRRDEVVARIDRVIANELEHISVEFIGPGLDLDIDIRSGIAPVLGRIVARLYF